ncbi:MAG: sodium:solute symporter [Crocinitomix sp.]|nr:sodium:solute symporter [Crocinitomix sp.]
MDKSYIIIILVSYFLVLMGISYLTSRNADNETFFTGNRNNKWYLVAFGMIGASLSGVTFISIPGVIGNSSFTYLQMAIGYIIGYAIIAFVLLPLYYRLNLTSIYEFLKQRFGHYTYKMGAGFFIVSRLIGAALRMYLVAIVLQKFVFDDLGVEFEYTVAISILLIWVYTFRGGIKTIIWTDTLQTLFMLISVGLSIYFISDDLNLQLGQIFGAIDDAGIGEVFQTEDGLAKNYWIKGILGGMFITLGMTGVDQDMMQKNLTCKNEKEAKKNMISFSIVLFFVNILFVTLGGLLFLYIDANPDVAEIWNSLGKDGKGQGDLLFATISLKGGLSGTVGVFFLLGLIAAAYSSADSALTSLTTSLSVDFLNIENDEKKVQERKRRMAHVIMSFALLITILIFKYANNDSVVWTLFAAASYTYGPLLGLFMFGIISKRKVADHFSIPISIIIPTLLFLFNWNLRSIFSVPESEPFYEFGSEMLGINAFLVFICLWIFSTNNVRNKEIY